jgi:F-type H+-transporting ATPase subunit delta
MLRRVSARRHAQAIFQIARTTGELEEWREELKRVAQAVADPALSLLLESPRLALAEKVALLQEKLPGAEPLVLNYAGLLVARGRQRLAGEIAEEYERLLDAYHGIEHAEVITAVPLVGREMESLGQRLTEMVGKKVLLKAKVDPAIIGGLVARAGDRLLDGSTRTRLQLLKKSLSEGGTGNGHPGT